jgi:hypothetical protein
MTEQEARRSAEEQKAAYQVPLEWGAGPADLRWIELSETSPGEPAPVKDLRAWVIRFRTQIQWADLAIDDASGKVVRVERSR